MRKLQIGDYIRITNKLGQFTTYLDWAKFHGLKKYRRFKSPSNYMDLFKIVAMGPHLTMHYPEGLIGIKNTEGEFIWNANAVELAYRISNELLKLIT